MLDKARGYKNDLTGSAFHKWLDSEYKRSRQAVIEADKYIEWEKVVITREFAKVEETKEAAHRARLGQIFSYCAVYHVTIRH